MITRIIQKTVIFNAQNQTLMLRRSKTDIRRPLQWDLAGGIREDGEELLSGVKREILEETGLDINKIEPVYAKTEVKTWETKDGKKTENVVYIFYVAKTSETNIKISYEHDKFQWKSLDEAIEAFEYPLHRELLEHVKSHDLVKDALSE
jgi:8-oxo-dGTP pyrophosphatase MutT (NUDIX family)